MSRVVVGRIVRAHGVRGELGVRVDDPQTSSLLEVDGLYLSGESEARELVSARPVHSEVLIRLRGVDDRTAAEALRGRDVELPRDALPEPEEGEFYFSDLVGLEAVDESGKALGKVQGIWETGPVPVIVIGEGASELLIPYAEDFVVRVDLAAKQMVIRPPEYDQP